MIKQQAREKLRHGNWVFAVSGVFLLLFIYLLITSIGALADTVVFLFEDKPAVISDFGSIIANSVYIALFIFSLPIINGHIRMYFRLACGGQKLELSELIYYFSSPKLYFRAFSLDLSYIIRMIIPAMLFFAPPILFSFLYYEVFFSMPTAVYTIILVVLCVMSAFLLFVYSIRYFEVFTVFCNNDTMKNSEYFTFSKKVMNGHTYEVVKLFLSFVPWLLLCFLALPFLYVLPYFSQSMCISAKWLLFLYKDRTDI